MTPNGAENPVTDEPRAPAARAAWAMFTALLLMNVLDYTDRFVLNSVLPRIQTEFRINNERMGYATALFLISYSIISPIMGYASDRWNRTRLLCLGVGVWSLATVGTGLARSYNQVLLARSFLGVGEATYGVIAPTMLMDLFSRRSRARIMSAFYLGMPLGAALGLGLGTAVANLKWGPGGAELGWRAAFFVVGAPGILTALAALFLPDPPRGQSEGLDAERLRVYERFRPSRNDYLDAMVNSSFTYSVFGMAMYTFAIGGLSAWFPKMLISTRGLPEQSSNWILGGITALAAIGGMTLGGWLADTLSKRSAKALFLVPGCAMLLAVPFIISGLLINKSHVSLIYLSIFLCEFFMFMNTGPCNAIIANVVEPKMRASAYAVTLFAVHVLGDIWSPVLIGKTADLYGDPEMMATSIGRLLASIGAVPSRSLDRADRFENMVAGMLITVPAVVISGITLLAGARHIEREMKLMSAKLKAASRPLDEPAAET